MDDYSLIDWNGIKGSSEDREEWTDLVRWEKDDMKEESKWAGRNANIIEGQGDCQVVVMQEDQQQCMKNASIRMLECVMLYTNKERV